MSNKIHKTALVDKGAQLGEGVEVGPFCVIEAGAVIGEGCVLGPRVTVFSGVRMESGCRVHTGAVLGDTPQDIAFRGDESFVEIGRDCVLREGVTIHRGTKAGSVTVIGPECFLMGFSHFAHNVRLGSRVIVVNGALIAGYAEIGDRAFISGNCAVHQFVHVGQMSMLGGGCIATKDVPPFATLRPAGLNEIAGINVIGMRRAGLSSDQRMAVKQAYNLLFHSELSPAEAAERIKAEMSDHNALEVAEFVERSTRGLCCWKRG